jgi:hypothetical protein
MKTALLAQLEKAIGDCLDKAAEQVDHWPDDGFFPPELPKRMAQAAALVFDANYDGQAFAEQESQTA